MSTAPAPLAIDLAVNNPEGLKLRDIDVALERIASTDVVVLIRGESGVGKEMVAKKLHAFSARRDHPFVKVNCAALPEGLLESELFGHEPGSFTGASTRRIGKFEEAHQGTLMLDEIGDLRSSLQAKLLQVLQDGSFNRVGSNKTLSPDVRVLAATNRDLERMLTLGKFREDLYYRLQVIQLVIPPLRERPGEILPLANSFLETYAAEYGRPVPVLSASFREQLRHYRWPGNVRELENLMKSLVVLQDETLLRTGWSAADGRSDNLVSESSSDGVGWKGAGANGAVHNGNGDGMAAAGKSAGDGDGGAPISLPQAAREAMMHVERTLMLDMLERVRWNRRRAAPLLGVSYKTLLNKIREHHIEPEE